MKPFFLVLATALFSTASTVFAAEPLPSWNDTAPKRAIVQFVERITKVNSPDFVPLAQRIATFDNDGTLWCEQPLYFQLLFAIHRVSVLAPQHPEWKNTKPFASLLEGDVRNALSDGEQAMMEIVAAMHAGMTTEKSQKESQQEKSARKVRSERAGQKEGQKGQKEGQKEPPIYF